MFLVSIYGILFVMLSVYEAQGKTALNYCYIWDLDQILHTLRVVFVKISICNFRFQPFIVNDLYSQIDYKGH